VKLLGTGLEPEPDAQAAGILGASVRVLPCQEEALADRLCLEQALGEAAAIVFIGHSTQFIGVKASLAGRGRLKGVVVACRPVAELDPIAVSAQARQTDLEIGIRDFYHGR
jgi:hypothetical protein